MKKTEEKDKSKKLLEERFGIAAVAEGARPKGGNFIVQRTVVKDG